MPQGVKHRAYKKETTRYRFYRPTIKPEDEDLLRRGTHYVTQTFKGFAALGYIAGIADSAKC
jgi:hypothetical protein